VQRGDLASAGAVLRAKLRLELARLHAGRDRGAALVEARAAAAIHSRLQLPIPREHADVLRDLGVEVPGVPSATGHAARAATQAVLARTDDNTF
jgi:hypothetical protein